MASESTAMEIRDNPEERRYEAHVEGRLAKIDYWLGDGSINMVHTEVPEELEGHGVGSRLVKFALDDARDRGLQVIPSCPFVAAYIERHQEYQALVRQREEG